MSDTNQILGVGSRVDHPTYADGVIIGIDVIAYKVCFILYGIKNVGKDYTGWEVVEALPAEEVVSFSEAEKALVKILNTYNVLQETVDLGDKWDGGKMILKPADESMKPKEIPIDTFFHKIVMVRDRLRVMEQRINSSKLTDEEKVNLQQYITKIYGSLTSFNVLFKFKEHNFVGDKS